jgi:hypothetical protein
MSRASWRYARCTVAAAAATASRIPRVSGIQELAGMDKQEAESAVMEGSKHR